MVDSFSKIAIVGLGLMGASMAKQLRHYHPLSNIIGVTSTEETLEKARQNAIFSNVVATLSALPTDVDLVIICTPTHVVSRTIAAVSAHFSGHPVVITDISSVKGDLKSVTVPSPQCLLLGHPMYGSEHQGYDAGIRLDCDGAPYILCPQDHPGYDKLQSLLESANFRVIALDADRHDRYVAAVSHLPYAVAASLVKTLGSFDPAHLPLLASIAGPGLRDTTRVSASSTQWAIDVLQQNKATIIPLLKETQASISGLISLLEHGDPAGVEQWLEDILDTRHRLFPPH